MDIFITTLLVNVLLFLPIFHLLVQDWKVDRKLWVLYMRWLKMGLLLLWWVGVPRMSDRIKLNWIELNWVIWILRASFLELFHFFFFFFFSLLQVKKWHSPDLRHAWMLKPWLYSTCFVPWTSLLYSCIYRLTYSFPKLPYIVSRVQSSTMFAACKNEFSFLKHTHATL